MKTYIDFEEAYKAWREDGGAMNYHGPSQHGPDCWEVDDADAMQERVACTAREATVIALDAGGMSYTQIAEAMADFVDPAQPEANQEATDDPNIEADRLAEADRRVTLTRLQDIRDRIGWKQDADIRNEVIALIDVLSGTIH